MKISFKRIFYYASFSIYCLYRLLTSSMLGQNQWFLDLYPVICFLCIGLVLVHLMLINRYKKKAFIFYCLTMAIVAIVYLEANLIFPVVLTFLMLGSKNVSSKTIAKIYLCLSSIVLLTSGIAANFGLIEDRIFYRGDGIPRHSMGMTYVTIWSGILYFTLAAYIYLRYKKITVWELIAILALSYEAYVLSGTRLELLLMIVLLAFLIAYKINDGVVPNIIKLFENISLIVSCFVSFALVFLYASNPSKYAYLNKLFSNRFAYTLAVMQKYAIKPFGQYIRMQGYGTINFDREYGYFFVDSFYINYSLVYGWVLMAIFIVAFTYIFYKLNEHNQQWIMLFGVIGAIHGIIISAIVDPCICPFFIIASAEYNELIMTQKNDSAKLRRKRKTKRIKFK